MRAVWSIQMVIEDGRLIVDQTKSKHTLEAVTHSNSTGNLLWLQGRGSGCCLKTGIGQKCGVGVVRMAAMLACGKQKRL